MRKIRNKIDPQNDTQTKWMTTRPDVNLNIKCTKPSATGSLTNIPKSKAIFFIHGVAGSSDIWTSQLTYFSERGYHVIAPDLLGHGFSSTPDKPRLYTFEWLCVDCLTIFDQNCKDENVLVGHSYGTSIAAYIARKRESRVDKLVLMSGGAPLSLDPQKGVFSLPSVILSCLRPALKRIFYRSAFHKNSKDLLNKEKAFDVPLYVLRHIMKGQVWPDGDEDFHKHIKQPTLLLHGVGDRLEETHNTLQMHQVLPISEFYIIDDASHMIMMEQPTLVNKLVEKFLMSEPKDQKCEESLPSLVDKGEESPRIADNSRPSNAHSHMTKSQPNLRRATLTA